MRHIRRITILVFALAVILYIATGIKLRMGEDKTIPVITSDREVLQISVNVTEEQLLEGLTALDKEDGDLTQDIIVGSISKFIKPGTVNVSYVVFDKNYNAGQFVRKAEFTNYQPPEFELKNSLDYPVGANIRVLEVLKAYDSIDGDITDKIRIVSGGINNKQVGTYKITAQVSNDYGDTVEQELMVNVNEKTAVTPEIELKNYLVYLEKGSKFSAQDYIKSVADYKDNAIDKNFVKIRDNVNTNQPGTYQVTYMVEDENGHEGVRHMMVVVKE